ncbi:MAG TPA: GNAT family N-acetyltransferase [Nocardioidaceae bacterium]|nr:GNAT family N-acetyltransferase [Nocardioidaceae bacterium]
MRIEPLDARDEVAMKAWHDAFLASQQHGRPHAVPMRLEEMRAKFIAERDTERDLGFSGTVDGSVVAVGQVYLTLRDNLDQAFLEVNTHPDGRGRGHGTQMLDHLEQVARDHDRSVLVGEVAYPFEAPTDGAGTPYAEFVRRRGYTFALGNVQRVLDLPADEAMLRALVEEAEPHHRGYTFRQFTGAVPEDLVGSFVEIVGTLMTEAPTGEIDHEPEVFDVARVRADEEVFAASGRTKFTTVAVDGKGEVAAYSEIVLPAFDPGKVYQWGTLARPQDRGRRLGLATKARNLLWAQPQLGRATLVTFNAEVNAHMIGVNERMGFRPVERVGEYQKRL